MKYSPESFILQNTHKSSSLKNLKGVLVCLDGYMNVAMEQTEEFVDGVLRNKYGDTMIRGNNVLYISQLK